MYIINNRIISIVVLYNMIHCEYFTLIDVPTIIVASLHIQGEVHADVSFNISIRPSLCLSVSITVDLVILYFHPPITLYSNIFLLVSTGTKKITHRGGLSVYSKGFLVITQNTAGWFSIFIFIPVDLADLSTVFNRFHVIVAHVFSGGVLFLLLVQIWQYHFFFFLCFQNVVSGCHFKSTFEKQLWNNTTIFYIFKFWTSSYLKQMSFIKIFLLWTSHWKPRRHAVHKTKFFFRKITASLPSLFSHFFIHFISFSSSPPSAAYMFQWIGSA